MSLDFPNRADWLRVRASKPRKTSRFLHTSSNLIHVLDEQTGARQVLVAKGKTYRRPA